MKITFEASDFDGNSFGDPCDCAMARAMRRAGADLRSVGASGWTDGAGNNHRLTESGRKLDLRLAGLGNDNWSTSKKKNPFIGKSFYV